MNKTDVISQLERIASLGDFAERSAELTQAWVAAGAGIETVGPVLRFMERHPGIDYGTPGALVHFLEQFVGNGYESALMESVGRAPTPATVWMLNRAVNGAKVPDAKRRLVASMEQAAQHPLADERTRLQAGHFLERLRGE